MKMLTSSSIISVVYHSLPRLSFAASGSFLWNLTWHFSNSCNIQLKKQHVEMVSLLFHQENLGWRHYYVHALVWCLYKIAVDCGGSVEYCFLPQSSKHIKKQLLYMKITKTDFLNQDYSHTKEIEEFIMSIKNRLKMGFSKIIVLLAFYEKQFLFY